METRDLQEASHPRAKIVQQVEQAALDITTARSFEEALHTFALQVRLAVGAHQCAVSYVPLGDFDAAIHTHSFSEKYEQYNSYHSVPTGSGVWGLVVTKKQAVRMSEQELLSHPMWRGLGDKKDPTGLSRPPLRGWLAAPVMRPGGEVLGVLQLSDKLSGADFTEEDLGLLIRLAHMASAAFELHYLNEQLLRRTRELDTANAELEAGAAELRRANEALQQANEALLRNEEASRRASQFHEAVVTNMAEGLYTIDDQEELISMNPAAEEILGWSLSELRGRNMHEVIHHHHPDGRPYPSEECPVVQVLRNGKPLIDQDDWCIRKGGRFFPAIYNATPLLLDGEVVGVVVVFRDMTERRRAEEQRRRLQAHIQHLQKLESLGVLAGGIAHDFNNLLTGILGYADLALLKLTYGSPARPLISEIVSGARRAAELTKQMLAYSGKGRFVVQPLDLSALVEDMVRLLQISISKKCVMEFDLAPEPPFIEADAAQIRQVVMNLVINASEAIGERSGVITIKTGVMHCDRGCMAEMYLDEDLPEGEYVTLEVRDNGCGMSEETRTRIFEPFFTTKFPGRGLGLAAVLGIVRGHRGAMKCESEPGKGTTFKILWPPVTLQGTIRGRASGAGAGLWRGRGKVLVVDDEASVLAMASEMLRALGFTVLTARDGREGIDVFSEHADDVRLVLLDMTMPRLDGEETLRELRRLRPDVKVILTSGYNEQTVKSRFEDDGMAGFIQKPYRLEELKAVIQRALEG